jgi:hypothetical protein
MMQQLQREAVAFGPVVDSFTTALLDLVLAAVEEELHNDAYDNSSSNYGADVGVAVMVADGKGGTVPSPECLLGGGSDASPQQQQKPMARRQILSLKNNAALMATIFQIQDMESDAAAAARLQQGQVQEQFRQHMRGRQRRLKAGGEEVDASSDESSGATDAGGGSRGLEIEDHSANLGSLEARERYEQHVMELEQKVKVYQSMNPISADEMRWLIESKQQNAYLVAEQRENVCQAKYTAIMVEADVHGMVVRLLKNHPARRVLENLAKVKAIEAKSTISTTTTTMTTMRGPGSGGAAGSGGGKPDMKAMLGAALAKRQGLTPSEQPEGQGGKPDMKAMLGAALAKKQGRPSPGISGGLAGFKKTPGVIDSIGGSGAHGFKKASKFLEQLQFERKRADEELAAMRLRGATAPELAVLAEALGRVLAHLTPTTDDEAEDMKEAVETKSGVPKGAAAGKSSGGDNRPLQLQQPPPQDSGESGADHAEGQLSTEDEKEQQWWQQQARRLRAAVKAAETETAALSAAEAAAKLAAEGAQGQLDLLQTEIEIWAKRKRNAPERDAAEAEREKEWASANEATNKRALRLLRSFMPPDIGSLTKEAFEERVAVAVANKANEEKVDNADEKSAEAKDDTEGKSGAVNGPYPPALMERLKGSRLLQWAVTHPRSIASANFLAGAHKTSFLNLHEYDSIELVSGDDALKFSLFL